MNRELVGGSPSAHARITGLVGLVMLVSGSFAGSVSARLFVRDDAAATAANLVASEPLLRLGLASSLVMIVAGVFYALLLYGLFMPVDKRHARAMLVLFLVSAPIFMLNQVSQYAALLSAHAGQPAQVELFLELLRLGNQIAGIFFGLWLFPLGVLAFKARFVPKLLGVLLMLGSPGYVVVFVQAFFFPGSERTLWTNPLLVLTHVSELALLAWLLIRGVNAERWSERAA